MPTHLHIVAFNVPYPADYGGVIDVYHRVRSLSKAGVRVHLHCYTYGRKPAPELEKLCEEVRYYRREMRPKHLLSKRPFIVSSRCSKDLIGRLQQDEYPIFVEGLHVCDLLEKLRDDERRRGARHRKIFVRAHNVEHEYYGQLALVEKRVWKRPYLKMDARKLRRYESTLLLADGVFAVTEADAAHFRAMHCSHVVVMPTSHPYDEVTSEKGRGDYAFYHADLSVPENISACRWLIDNVFADSKQHLVLAGRNPNAQLVQLVRKYPNVELVASPDEATMERLTREAQVHILVTAQATGLKLKLLNSLYAGRHCLVNSSMVAGTPLAKVCHVADTPEDMRAQLEVLMHTDFTQEDIDLRKQQMGDLYDNAANVQRLMACLG